MIPDTKRLACAMSMIHLRECVKFQIIHKFYTKSVVQNYINVCMIYIVLSVIICDTTSAKSER